MYLVAHLFTIKITLSLQTEWCQRQHTTEFQMCFICTLNSQLDAGDWVSLSPSAIATSAVFKTHLTTQFGWQSRKFNANQLRLMPIHILYASVFRSMAMWLLIQIIAYIMLS